MEYQHLRWDKCIGPCFQLVMGSPTSRALGTLNAHHPFLIGVGRLPSGTFASQPAPERQRFLGVAELHLRLANHLKSWYGQQARPGRSDLGQRWASLAVLLPGFESPRQERI